MTSREAAKTLLLCGYKDGINTNDFVDAICMAIYALMKQEEVHGKHEEKESIWHDAKTEKPTVSGEYYIIREEMPGHIYTVHYDASTGWWTGEACVYNDVAEWTEYKNIESRKG